MLSTACGGPASEGATPAADGPIVVYEAEVASGSGGFTDGADPAASGGRYLVQPPVVSGAVDDEEDASIAVTVPVDGEYTLWVRWNAPATDADALYLGLDGRVARVYSSRHGSYVWSEIARDHLSAEGHRISIGLGEPGVMVDLFALVADPDMDSADLEARFFGSAPGDGEDAPRARVGSLRGDQNFDRSRLDDSAALWYDRLWASLENPHEDLDPMTSAASDDVYEYGRSLHTYVQSVLTAFRLTGDLRLLDEIDRIAERMRDELRDAWRDTTDGTDGTTDGYLNWVYRYSGDPEFQGKDTHEINEMRAHGLVAMIAYALDVNRDLESPEGRDYGSHADFWRDYLVNHFEAKWRERKGVPSGFPIMVRPHTHTYYSWMKWHYYMARLTGEAAYLAEAERMAGVLWNDEIRPVATPQGTAYVWARSVLAEGGGEAYLHPTTYARYVFGDLVDLHFEGFGRWGSREEMARFARTVAEFVIDTEHASSLDWFANDVGGGTARAGLPSDDVWGRMDIYEYGSSPYALIGAWDASSRVDDISLAVWSEFGGAYGIYIAAGLFVSSSDDDVAAAELTVDNP